MTFDIVQPEVRTRPIGGLKTWQAVMEAAGYRCQCSGGLCGSKHAIGGLVCGRLHDEDWTPGDPSGRRVRLIAAPLDLAQPLERAAGLRPDQLRAWCTKCYTAARSQQRAAAAEMARHQSQPEALFDL